jgi:outer membrane receptor protein involved in Fe transport
MRKITFLTGLLVLIFFIPAFGQVQTNRQAPSNRAGMANMPADGKITGKLVDGTTNQPIEYASVAIYRSKDSTLVTGVVSDANGNFVLDNLPYGRFYALFNFIGYKKNRVDGIMVIPNQKVAAMGTIKLETSSTALKEVVVVGNGNQIEYKIDKKVVNISQNIIASGGTVVDALANTPSVQTDVEGNVTVRGSSNFTVLIDGKPSVVSGSEALQQIPAALVQNVEIITNPSAKYDAEGSAGIINVIMKKQKVKGFNGNISLSAGTNRKNNDNFLINYKVSKFNFSLGADFTDMAFKMTNTSDRNYFVNGDATKTQQMDGSGQFSRKGKGLKGGIEYNINDKNTLSFSGRYGDRSFSRPMNVMYTDFYPLTGNSVYYKSNSSGESKDIFYSMSLDHNLKINNNGQQLATTIYYSKSKENDPSLMFQDTTDILGNPLQTGYSQRTAESGDEYEFRFKSDYTLPLGEKKKLEAGIQSRLSNNSADHHFFVNEVENLGQLDQLDFKEYINAGYVTFSNATKIFDYQLGLRAEHENRNVNQKNMNSDTIVKRIDFFPTIHISKQLPWDLQLQASYTRRTNRPRDWDLSPLKRYMDPQNIRVGNPGLLPEFTDAYELNLQKKINEASFISAEGFYRKTNNPIQQITTNIGNINYMTSENLGKDESAGVEFMLNMGLLKWWTLNGSSSIYNRKLTGNMESVSSKSSTDWNLKATSMMRLKTGTVLQVNYMYNAPTITAQGTRGAFYTTSVAIRQDFFKRKLGVTLQFRDIIGDMKMRMTTETSTLYSYNQMKRENKVIVLSLSFKINNYKAERRSTEEINSGSDNGSDANGGMM